MGKVGYFEEKEGHKSGLRMNTFLLLLFFFTYNGIWAYGNAHALMNGLPIQHLSDTEVWFNTAMLVFVFAPKVAQKLVEMKFGGGEKKDI